MKFMLYRKSFEKNCYTAVLVNVKTLLSVTPGHRRTSAASTQFSIFTCKERLNNNDDEVQKSKKDIS